MKLKGWAVGDREDRCRVCPVASGPAHDNRRHRGPALVLVLVLAVSAARDGLCGTARPAAATASALLHS